MLGICKDFLSFSFFQKLLPEGYSHLVCSYEETGEGQFKAQIKLKITSEDEVSKQRLSLPPPDLSIVNTIFIFPLLYLLHSTVFYLSVIKCYISKKKKKKKGPQLKQAQKLSCGVYPFS